MSLQVRGQQYIVGEVGGATRLLRETPTGEVVKGPNHYTVVIAGGGALYGTVEQPAQMSPNQTSPEAGIR